MRARPCAAAAECRRRAAPPSSSLAFPSRLDPQLEKAISAFQKPKANLEAKTKALVDEFGMLQRVRVQRDIAFLRLKAWSKWVATQLSRCHGWAMPSHAPRAAPHCRVRRAPRSRTRSGLPYWRAPRSSSRARAGPWSGRPRVARTAQAR